MGRIRFSLRSFVLLAIAFSAGYGLWQRWDAWTETIMLPGNGRVLMNLQLSPDEETLLAVPKYVEADPSRKKVSQPLEAWLWNARTGIRERVISWSSGPLLYWGNANFVNGSKQVEFIETQAASDIIVRHTLRLFDTASGADLLPSLPHDAIQRIRYSGDGRYAFLDAGLHPPPFVLDLEHPGKPLALKDAPSTIFSLEATFSPDGNTVIIYNTTNDESPAYAAYSLASGERLQRKAVRWGRYAAFLADGERVVVQGDRELDVEVWDWRRGECLGKLDEAKTAELFALGPDRIYCLYQRNSTAALYDQASLRKVADLEGELFPFESRSPSGNRFATVLKVPLPHSQMGALKVAELKDVDTQLKFIEWDAASGKMLYEVTARHDPLQDLPIPRYSSDDRWICAASKGASWVWQAESGGGVKTIRGKAAILGDSLRYAVVGNQGDATVHDIESGEELFELMPGATQATGIQTTRDGRHLYIAGFDGNLHCFYRRRPEQWWGIAWLPEFWVALVVAPALLWSFVRDFRTLGRAKAGD